MLRVTMVDDGPPAIRGMEDHPDAEIVGTAESVAAAAALVSDTRPDAVFLDVTLSDGEGFDLLACVVPRPVVVLVTASAAHAVRAFEIGAIDVLLKPVEPSRLAITMRRVRNACAGVGLGAIAENGTVRSGRIVASEGSDTVVVSVSEIGHLAAEADFARIMFVDGRDLLVCRGLGHFEGELPTPPFCRLGHSIIVNLDHLERIERRRSDGSLQCVTSVAFF